MKKSEYIKYLISVKMDGEISDEENKTLEEHLKNNAKDTHTESKYKKLSSILDYSYEHYKNSHKTNIFSHKNVFAMVAALILFISAPIIYTNIQNMRVENNLISEYEYFEASRYSEEDMDYSDEYEIIEAYISHQNRESYSFEEVEDEYYTSVIFSEDL